MLFWAPLSGWSKSKALPPILQAIETSYAQAKTISAEFIQINTDVAFSREKRSSGKIFIKHPSKVRWETTAPESSLLISNGVRFWFYTPPFEEGERGQIIEKKAAKVQSKWAHTLLAGSFSNNRDLRVIQKAPNVFALIPRPGTAGTVVQATVEVDPARKLIQKVMLNHKGGNHSEISLAQIELGKPLSDDFFQFQVPPNTDRLGEKPESF